MGIEIVTEYWEIILITLTSAWFLLAIASEFGDTVVEYIDEYLLKRIDGEDETDEVDAPGRLVLISGFFGTITASIILFYAIITGTFSSLLVFEPIFLSAVGAGVFEVLWLIPYFYAIYRGGVIDSTPLFQTIPIFSLIFGVLLFSEIPPLIHVIATLIIITGALLLNTNKETGKIKKSSVILMLFASAIISMGYFLFKDAAVETNFLTALLGNSIGMVCISLIIWTSYTPYRRQFNSFISGFNIRIFFTQFVNEGLYTVSAVAGQLALTLGPSVVAVSALGGLKPVFTLLCGGILALSGSVDYKEELGGGRFYRKIPAILLIAFGTVLFAF